MALPCWTKSGVIQTFELVFFWVLPHLQVDGSIWGEALPDEIRCEDTSIKPSLLSVCVCRSSFAVSMCVPPHLQVGDSLGGRCPGGRGIRRDPHFQAVDLIYLFVSLLIDRSMTALGVKPWLKKSGVTQTFKLAPPRCWCSRRTLPQQTRPRAC